MAGRLSGRPSSIRSVSLNPPPDPLLLPDACPPGRAPGSTKGDNQEEGDGDHPHVKGDLLPRRVGGTHGATGGGAAVACPAHAAVHVAQFGGADLLKLGHELFSLAANTA